MSKEYKPFNYNECPGGDSRPQVPPKTEEEKREEELESLRFFSVDTLQDTIIARRRQSIEELQTTGKLVPEGKVLDSERKEAYLKNWQSTIELAQQVIQEKTQ